MSWYYTYKEKIHFSLNFYSLFLIATFIPDIIGVPPSLITNIFWGIKVLLAGWIIVKYRRKLYRLSWSEKLYLFVAFVYFINIFIDVFWQKIPIGMGNPIDLAAFFLSIIIALSFRYEPIFCSERSYYFFLISLAFGLFVAFFLATKSPPPLIGRYDANSTVNTINYGQMGCALSLVSIYGFLNFKFKYSRIIYPILFLLGIISIMKAGSRSPIVVLLVVSIFYFYAKSGFVKGIILIGCSIIMLYFSIGFLIELSEAVGSSIVTRILSAIEKGETSGRDAIYANAIGHFKDNPLFGDYYLIPSGIAKGFYPHNFFIEAFMATGILGGIPFVIMVIICVIKSFRLLKAKHPSGWINLLFLQTLVYGMFSSSLYSSQDFWALSFFIISMNATLDQKRTRRIKTRKPLTTNREREEILPAL